MRIGGKARYFAELRTKEDAEESLRFAMEKDLVLFVLGSGSNTVFADDIIEAIVVRVLVDNVTRDGSTVTVQCGKNLPMLVNELAACGLDLSALTGIPGTVGGAVFGNAGQGPRGIWINHFVRSVTYFDRDGWHTIEREACGFLYRESRFHHDAGPCILWEVTLTLPERTPTDITADIQNLLKKRIETQPHLKTAGSCFKAMPDGTPAWKLIDAAGLRGMTVGGIQIAEKHANFLLNIGGGTFQDICAMKDLIRTKIPAIAGIEMRLCGNDGRVLV